MLISNRLKQLIYYSKIFAPSRYFFRNFKAIILRYHSVSDKADSNYLYLEPRLAVSPPAFENQIRFVKKNYNVVSLDEIISCITHKKKLPPYAVAITFDDGYRDNYLHAFPILKKYSVPATFYLTAGCIDQGGLLWPSSLRYAVIKTREKSLRIEYPVKVELDLSTDEEKNKAFDHLTWLLKSIDNKIAEKVLREIMDSLGVKEDIPMRFMMSWDEVKEMSQSGFLFGAHTITHPNLPNLPIEKAREEIEESKRIIEDRLGPEVKHFSYPNGRGVNHFTEDVKGLVRKAGFLSAATSINGCINVGTDPFELKRIGIYKRFERVWELNLAIERAKLTRNK